ncbi:MAG TPA: hypothetical protein VGB94_13250, partial [Acidobacteriaceae bacterium]
MREGGRRFTTIPTHRKERDVWGTRFMGNAGGAVEKQILRCAQNDKSKWNGGWMQLEAMAVEFPAVHGHPNRMPFEGVLTLVDVASDKAPAGARGHRVVLTKRAAEAALPSLLGMAVDFNTGWDGHDARQKCGIITAAEIEGQRLLVSGYLFARDFPEMETQFRKSGPNSLGMSYE